MSKSGVKFRRVDYAVCVQFPEEEGGERLRCRLCRDVVASSKRTGVSEEGNLGRLYTFTAGSTDTRLRVLYSGTTFTGTRS
jgi:hypothetical protein